MPLYDAHCHFHDARLAAFRPDFVPALESLKVRAAVVNGTSEGDWSAVAAFAAEHSWAVPSFGLHPWQVPQRTPLWKETLLHQLDANPRACVGEIGLDRWVNGHDVAEQSAVFRAQLTIAGERELPVSVHCILAWGELWEIIRSSPLPACGFLLHAYGGPWEMVQGFVERGAYFSFSPHFLHARKEKQRAVFARLPADRLLVETDAPDLRPPDERNAHPLHAADGEAINHPANLEVAYQGLAEVRKMDASALEALVAENFARLFGR